MTSLMRSACAALATVTFSVGASTIVGVSIDGGNAEAAPSTSSTRHPKPKSPKPTVKGTTNRRGATIGGSTAQSKRLHPKKQSETPPATKTIPARSTTPRRYTQANDDGRRPFRLNIGICGMRQNDGTVPGPNRCQPVGPNRPVPPTIGVSRRRLPEPADVTWEQVLAESKNVLFPGLRVNVQPAGRTLVNLNTIVYTDDSKVSSTQVTLLGFLVDVEATPMSYVWSFGDGTTLTTTYPGKPYPAKDITHKYLKRGSVNITLTTSYAARFRVAGGDWQYVDGIVPITGPATPLLVREAVPVLVEPPG